MSTSPSSSVQQARQALADRLREIRMAASLTGTQLAAAAGWDRSKVSKLEHAVTSPSADDIRAWCRLCGVPDRADDLVAARHEADSLYLEWRRLHRSGLRRQQESRLPLYERTHGFRSYSSWLVPGLLQTRAYAACVLESIMRRDKLPDDLEAAVAARMERQRVLYESGRRFAFLVEESVLRSTVTDAETMAGQLDHLLVVPSLPAVSLGVIPAGVGRARWPVEGFWVFDDVQVNVELVSGYLTIRRPAEVAEYGRAFSDLAGMAVYGRDARALIAAAIEALG
ncbi:helix-turn-helix domain-containing protein [Actinomadura rubrisoli]|uniref:XRE family transcriptional regulator n=1 Tax=Actinomadura rubrisoli TaxID=2530368 RepID=A0A4R5A458_9ACTN|nr:helix-turn-helix transcriptional regulator [Actinomadura rubrisoli]TDD65676.1 XRE family transcriptional regulator [Actinomadura rubrisoli]